MKQLLIDEYLDHTCDISPDYTLSDYEGNDPRWCKGCGDFAVLSAVQRIFRDNQIKPEEVVCVSGIGCSSRFPYYLKTYGFHGIHGRALPISTGVALARPDLHVLTVMGDGDCFSIGAGHWIHALRYNVNITVLVFDNQIYALTKKQASPTTKQGTSTNTSPRGAYLEAMNPLSIMLGITSVSFLAQSATWLPAHLIETIKTAWNHRGLSFVRILQRCPVFSPNAFSPNGDSMVGLLFLQNKDGIPVHPSLHKMGTVVEHDQSDIEAAQRMARGNGDGNERIGLLYRNDKVPVYDNVRRELTQHRSPEERLSDLNAELDKFTI